MFAAPIFGALGTAVSIAGQVASMGAQADAANYRADLAERNSRVVSQETAAAIEDKKRENQRQLGAVRAAWGASGFDMGGSPLDVLEDQALEQGYDIAKIKYKGAMQGISLGEQADMDRAAADNISASMPLSIAGIAINGASKTLADYNKLN